MLRHSTPGKVLLSEMDKVAAARRRAGNSFRNFGLNDLADEDQIYRGLGEPGATERCFAKLMHHMNSKYTYADGATTKGGMAENNGVPAGYTYLFQLAAHDMSMSSAFPGAIGENSFKAENRRQRQLFLDTLYGGGPMENEVCYELPARGLHHRMRLRMGSINPIPLPDRLADVPGCPFHMRDLPRILQPDLSDAPRAGRPDVLIADARNDDSPMLAQVTALFHMAHNAIIDELKAKLRLGEDPDNVPDEIRYFLLARHLLTRIYRSVLRNDLLPRLLNKHVLDLYKTNKFKPLVDPVSKTSGGQTISLEFSHAAARLGHAMVRSKYAFNSAHQSDGLRNALRTTSAKDFDVFPLKRNWVAEWSKFFELSSAPPQFSRRLGPGYTDVMLDERLFPFERVTDAINRDESGLLFRDLVRGTIAGLLKLQTVCDLLHDYDTPELAHVFDAGKRSAFIREWLSKSEIGFSKAELNALSSDPPLLVWLLIEASAHENGQRFGAIGSIILGDAFYAALANEPQFPVRDLNEELVEGYVFGNAMPQTMPDLIRFVNESLRLQGVEPRFM